MSPETIERLCAEALQRITYYINRAAAQHLRMVHVNAERARSEHAL